MANARIIAQWKNEDILPGADIARSKLAQVALGIDNIPLERLRRWDDRAVTLPAAAAADDLGLVTGTLGTDRVTAQAGDLKAAGATTRYAALLAELPADYEDGQTVTLRIAAGMNTTVADTACTIDAQVYRCNDDLTVGSDICATAAQNMNSTTFADFDFTITPTSLSAGDQLDIRLAIACNDAATVTAVIPTIASLKLLSDRR